MSRTSRVGLGLVIILAALIAVKTPSIAQNTLPDDVIYYVTNTRPPDAFLSLRTHPAVSVGQRILTMPNGTKLQVLQRRNDGWWYVRVIPSGQEGWVLSGKGNSVWIGCCITAVTAQTPDQAAQGQTTAQQPNTKQASTAAPINSSKQAQTSTLPPSSAPSKTIEEVPLGTGCGNDSYFMSSGKFRIMKGSEGEPYWAEACTLNDKFWRFWCVNGKVIDRQMYQREPPPGTISGECLEKTATSIAGQQQKHGHFSEMIKSMRFPGPQDCQRSEPEVAIYFKDSYAQIFLDETETLSLLQYLLARARAVCKQSNFLFAFNIVDPTGPPNEALGSDSASYYDGKFKLPYYLGERLRTKLEREQKNREEEAQRQRVAQAKQALLTCH